MRHLSLLILLAACKGGTPADLGGRAVTSTEIPTQWESSDSRIALRLTNATSTSTEVRRALNEIVNTRIDPVDLLMGGGLEFDAEGEVVPPTGSPTELLAGSAVAQAKAFLDQVVTAEEDPFEEGSVRDACGNETIFATVAPYTLQHIASSPQDLLLWPASCPDGADCDTTQIGTFDIELGEARFDGMINMTVSLYPDLSVDPIIPAFWGHFSGFFLTENNPNFDYAPMFANVGEARIEINNVWRLESEYADVAGAREVYAFPHRARTLDGNEISVELEPYSPTLDYWVRSDLGEFEVPFGADVAPIAVDITAPLGQELLEVHGTNDGLHEELTAAFEYQIGSMIACPSVKQTTYYREGPVEIFLCPDGDLETCIGQEDIEEAACALQPGLGASIPNLPWPGTGTIVPVPPAQSPVYLSYPSIAPDTELQISIDVNPDSVLYLLGPERIVSAVGVGGAVVATPDPIANTHCGATVASRYDVGAAWPADTYTVTLDLTPDPDGQPDSGDELVIDVDTSRLWVYFTSLETWRP